MPSPSPIAYNAGPPSPSMFKKKRSSSSLSPMSSAASYLAAVSQADARARSHNASPTSTPALSLSSTVTGSSEDTVLKEYDEEADDGPLSLPRVPPNSEQTFTTVHSEFGHCANEEYRYTSAHRHGTDVGLPVEKEPPYYIVLTTYCGYLILICLGHLRDFFGKRFYASYYTHLTPHNVSVLHLFFSEGFAAFWPANISLLHLKLILFYCSIAGICALEL